MKKRATVLLTICVLLIIACSPKMNIPFERTGKVSCASYDESVIHLVSESRAGNLNSAIQFAERNAVENLLFRGIPKSNQEKPMIANELDALGKNGTYFEELIKGERYQRFITQSDTRDRSINKKVHFVKQSITVDLAALRRDMEQNKVTRKFGL